jgi:hypothetical protein
MSLVFDTGSSKLNLVHIGNLEIPLRGYITVNESREEDRVALALKAKEDLLTTDYVIAYAAVFLRSRVDPGWTAEEVESQIPYTYIEQIFQLWQDEKKPPLRDLAEPTISMVTQTLSTGTQLTGDLDTTSPASKLSEESDLVSATLD